jgi:adenylate cyclase
MMHILLAGSLQQRLRLASGLILFAFALTHFLNHALGLVGIGAMEAVQDWRTMVTRSWLGSTILIGALLTHMTLALVRIARRTTLRMPPWEMLQIISGLLIPLLLIPHVVGTRIGWTFFGVDDEYTNVLATIWPDHAVNQSLLLLLVWIHGSAGLHFWLRLWSGYRSFQPVLLALAVAVPLLGLTGFVAAGREATAAGGQTAVASSEVLAALLGIAKVLTWTFAGLVAVAFAAVGLGQAAALIGRRIAVTYFAGPTVSSVVGPTLLEISRRKGVPHASVCGGRGRCSTCRVHIDKVNMALEPPNPVERRTLARIGATPGVRLACQFRPASDIAVTRLVKPGVRRALAAAESHGVERTLAVLFLDVRGFTKITEGRLPYDIVFMLNRLFEHMGEAIRSEGGRIEKYLGDGLMAVFGRESGGALGARQALRAVRAIDLALDQANAELTSELGRPVEIGLGLHDGPVVIGEIGHPSAMALDVIGETVNTAARLEALTKEQQCQLVVSSTVLELAGIALPDLARKSVTVRGIERPMEVVLADSARHLPDITLRDVAPPSSGSGVHSR